MKNNLNKKLKKITANKSFQAVKNEKLNMRTFNVCRFKYLIMAKIA